MFKKSKKYIIVGINVTDIVLLQMSVGALSKLSENIYLILFNNNPKQILKKSDILNLGFKNKFQIINSDKKIGAAATRIGLIKEAMRLKINAQWMVFCGQSDIITDLSVLNVEHKTYAVLQNTMCVRNNLQTVFNLIENPKYNPGNENVINIKRPDFDINGTMFVFDKIKDLIQIENNDNLNDGDIWAYLKSTFKDYEPIYMNQTNYIKIEEVKETKNEV